MVIENLGVKEIQEYQMNRYPCLFIDFIKKAEPGVYAEGYKNFTYNEWYFPTHFPDEPNVPGFIQVEALTQVFLMTFLTLPGNKGKKTGFASIKNAEFKRKVIPGDHLDIKAELKSYRRGVAKGWSSGYVNGELACKTELVIVIPDIMTQYIPR